MGGCENRMSTLHHCYNAMKTHIKPRQTSLTVAQLSGKIFSITNYNKDYRWTPREVTCLLDDIHNCVFFTKTESYNLQNIVVTEYKKRTKHQSDVWQLKDGAQRLITIFLILKHINIEPHIFSINYKIRRENTTFLNNINTMSISGDSHWEETYRACRLALMKADGPIKFYSGELDRFRMKVSNIPLGAVNARLAIYKFAQRIDSRECLHNDHFFFFEAYKAIIRWFEKNAAGKREKEIFAKKFLHRVKFVWSESSIGQIAT